MEMCNYRELHYKDKTPENTVAYLIGILRDLGLKVSERWYNDEVAQTHSLRVRFQGTDFGSNGKGVSKAYARASAYAELFERLQNGILVRCRKNQEDILKEKYGFRKTVDEKYCSIDELLVQNDAFMRYVLKEQGCIKNDTEWIYNALYELLKFDLNEQGKVLCLPFYSVDEDNVVYLPYNLYMNYYGSNGMAAGNSPEEAMVQGISEIIERYVQKKIHLEQPSLPEIPEFYLKKFPYLEERYNEIKNSNKNYVIKLFDCSFGGKYPVAGLAVIEKNTGKYGLKFGCHPDFAIAIERTITEASQGHKVTEYANRSIFDFFNKAVTSEINITNGYKYGHAQFPYQIFDNNADYAWGNWEKQSQLSNKDLLKRWVVELRKEGKDILVRDAGYLGFPSYHIIIPGFSEISTVTPLGYRAMKTHIYAKDLLNNNALVNKENAKYIIASLQYYADDLFLNRVREYYRGKIHKELPFEKNNCDCIYLAAMCYFISGDYDKAYEYVELVEKVLEREESAESDRILIKAIAMYLAGRKKGLTHKAADIYISLFFDDEIYKKISFYFEDETKVIMKQYPTVDEIDSENYSIAAYELLDTLKAEQKKNWIVQSHVREIFADGDRKENKEFGMEDYGMKMNNRYDKFSGETYFLSVDEIDSLCKKMDSQMIPKDGLFSIDEMVEKIMCSVLYVNAPIKEKKYAK